MGNLIVWIIGFLAGGYILRATGVSASVAGITLNIGSGKSALRTQIFDNELGEEERRARYIAYPDSYRRLV